MREYPAGSGKWFFQGWTIPPEVIAKTEADSLGMSRATDAEIHIPVPPGLELMGYQKAAVAFMMKRKATLVGDSMGLGKTVEAIAYINAMNSPKKQLHRILIVCPADLRLNWVSELRKWLTNRYTIDIVDDIFPSSDIVLISFHGLHKWEQKLTFYWDLVIVDEAQYVSNPKARMTRCLVGYRPSKKELSEGMAVTAGIPTKRKVVMTGTPIQNKPKNIWPMINWLDPITWYSWNRFAIEYCGARNGESWNDGGSSNELAFQEILRRTIMIRRLTADVLKDLPPIRRSTHVLPVNSTAAASIERMWQTQAMNEVMAKLSSAKADLEIAKCRTESEYQAALTKLDGVMGQFGAATFEMIHEIGKAKVPGAIEILKRVFEETPKFLIYTHHQDVTDAMHQAFPTAFVIDGRVDMTVRKQRVDAFQSNPTTGPFILTIDCAKGITLTAASLGYFVEGSWLPGRISQAEGRLYRYGQKDHVQIFHLVMEGSIDLMRADRIIRKQKVIESMLDMKPDEAEREPVMPMPGITITRDLVERDWKKFTTAESIAMVSAHCNQLVANSSVIKLAHSDSLILQYLIRYGCNSRTCVLGNALLEEYRTKK